jgi:hypothetical protein
MGFMAYRRRTDSASENVVVPDIFQRAIWLDQIIALELPVDGDRSRF